MSFLKKSKEEKRRVTISILVIFFLLFQFAIPSTKACADELSLDITDVSLLLDGSPVGDDGAPIDRDTGIQIMYSFNIPDNVQEGSTASLQLPEQFKIDKVIDNVPIKCDDGTKLADVVVDTNGKVLITFTKDAEGGTPAGLQVKSKFNQAKIGTSNPQNIEFKVNDTIVKTIPVNFKPKDKVDPKIDKTGEYDLADSTIKWTIKADPEQNLKNVTIVDTLGDYQTYKEGTFEVNGTNVNPSVNGNIISYTFPGEISTEQVITLKTTVNSDAPITSVTDKDTGVTTQVKHLENNAELKIDDPDYSPLTPGLVLKKNAYVNLSTNFLSKYGELIDNNSKILWHVAIQAPDYDLNNVVYTDKIEDGLSLLTQSNNKNELLQVIASDLKPDSVSERGFVYKFDTIKAGTTLQIMYATDITDKARYMVKDNASAIYYNTGTLEIPGLDPITINPSVFTLPKMIEKKAVSYDYSSKEASWEININPLSFPIENPEIIDTISKGQEYVEDSLEISEDDSDFKEVSYTSYDKETGKLVYNFSDFTGGTNKINKPYKIKLKTKVIDTSTINTNDAKLTNIVTIDGNGTECTTDADYPLKNGLINKTGEYDSTNRSMEWNIEVNKNQIKILNAVITDELPEGIEFDKDSSLKVYKGIINSDGSVSKGAELTLDTDYKFTSDNNIITVTMNTLDSLCIISFKTKVSDINSDQSNSVNIQGTGINPEEAKSEKIATIVQGAIGFGTRKAKVIINKVDSADGTAVFSGLEKNTKYYIQESSAPRGYLLDDTFYDFTTNGNGEPLSLTLSNKKKTSTSTSHHHHSSSDDDDDNDATDNTDTDKDDPNKQTKPTDLSDVIIVPSKTDTTASENKNEALTPVSAASNADKENVSKPEASKSDISKSADSPKDSSTKNTAKKLPKSGSMLDEKTLVFTGLLLIFSGLAYGYRRRISVKNLK